MFFKNDPNIKPVTIQESLADYGIQPVPKERMVGGLEIGFMIWGMNICLPAFILGSTIIAYATLTKAFLAIVLGSLILTLFGVGTGLVGTQTHLSTAISAQFSFGEKSRILLGVLLAVSSLGWYGIQLEIFGIALEKVILFLSNSSLHISRNAFILAGGVVMTWTAMFGQKAIAKLSFVAVPLLMFILLAPFFFSFESLSLKQALSYVPPKSMPLGSLVSTVVGAMASGMILLPDITRYSKSSKSTFLGISIGMMISYPLVLLLSAFFTASSGYADLIDLWLSFPHKVWGVFVLITIIFATWTTNDTNIYSAALALNSVFPRLQKWLLTILGGIIGTVAAITGLLKYFQQWLDILAVTITPIGAVLIIDLIAKRFCPHSSNSEKNRSLLYLSAWMAWFAGALVGALTFSGVMTVNSVPALNALLMTSVLYATMRAVIMRIKLV